MSSRGGARAKGNPALLRRVDVIESLLPAKPNRTNPRTGEPVGYDSARFQHIEELIGICRQIREPSADVAELHVTISELRTELRRMRQNHSQLKISNRELRAGIEVTA